MSWFRPSSWNSSPHMRRPTQKSLPTASRTACSTCMPKRRRFSRQPPYSSVRKLVRGLQNWSIRCWWAADISMPSMPAACAARRRREVGDDAADFLGLDGLGVALVHGLAHAGRADQVRPVFAMPGRAPAHVGRLDHDARAVAVHGLGQAAQRFDDAVGGKVDRAPPALRAVGRNDAGAAADGQPQAALGLFLVVAQVALAGQPCSSAMTSACAVLTMRLRS